MNHFLDLVEETRGDSDESFNYDVIRLVMVINEQYMMSGLDVNLVLDVLSERMGSSDTFSANLIFMLNRSSKCNILFRYHINIKFYTQMTLACKCLF